MNLSKSMQEYFNELSSNFPTPGGGNVAALCGALSSSLGIMVCNLTIGKKKYADVENEMINTKRKLEEYQHLFFELAEKDNQAFDKVMQAFRLPKETDSEKDIRNKNIEGATLVAAEIPSNVINACAELLPLLRIIIHKGNRNSLSDAGVAALLVNTASKAAYLNVLINCGSLSNQKFANELKKRVDIQIQEISHSCELLIDQVVSAVQPQ
jgi:methenyltetrahydrofolate cyclohydrolase